MSAPASIAGPARVYEFRVTGRIDPVIRSAIPELRFGATERSCILGGLVDGPVGLERLLDRLAGCKLDETEIRVHRIGDNPGAAPATTPRPPGS